MRRKKIKRPIQKRHYLLLEVLVCLTLVLVVLVPLIRPLYGIRKAEMERLVYDDLERNARYLMSDIKAALHEKRGDSWDELKEGCVREKGVIESNKRSYLFSYVIIPKDSHKKTSSQTIYLLAECQIHLKETRKGKDHIFSYPLLIEKREGA
jgi:hypothetical protein